MGEGAKGPLDGIRVVEFATMVSGPVAGQMLADLGAEVIKIEGVAGDPLRGVKPIHAGLSAWFVHCNRHKKSIALNLKSTEGLALARELCERADVVLENFRPGVMGRLGLSYDALSAVNPGLIYASITGYGPDGPYADRAAYDHVIQGMSGVMRAQSMGGPPQGIRNVLVDKTAAINMTNAILAALFHRERNGGAGQRVSVALLNSFATVVGMDMMGNHTFRGSGVEPVAPVDIYHPLKTLDGYVIGHIQLQSQFEAMCHVFLRTDLLDDARFNESFARARHYEALWHAFAVGAAQRTNAELLEDAARRGAALGPVYSIDEFFDDPQVIHAQAWFDYDDPDVGVIRQLGFPARLEASPANVQGRAPRLGEQTDAILRDLGHADAEVAAWRAARVAA